MSPDEVPAGALAGRLRQAFLASARDELLAPAQAILETSQALLDDLEAAGGDPGRQDLRDDLHKVRAAGRQLVRLIEETLGPAAPGREGAGPDPATVRSRVRHDMRNALNAVINYSELWLEEAAERGLDGPVADLNKLRDLGKRCCGLLDRMLDSLGAEAGDLACQPPEVQALLEDVVAYLRPPGEGPPPAAADRILVIDDNADNRDTLARHLGRQGYEVLVAANGRQGLEQVAARPVDLVLLDLIMPELNGFQVLERLKADERLRDIPVIVITALEDIDSVARCIEMGAEDYLPKPFNRVLLRARLGACLEKKRLRDREVLHLRQIEQERRRSDELLHVILPDEIVDELRTTNQATPRRYDNVAVLFADIVGFTPYCDRHPPEEVVAHLQQLVETWEELALLHGVEKVKTIGDAFMAACGLLKRVENPVLSCVCFGRDLIAAARRPPLAWDVRVGVHVGPVVAGVLGRRQYLFDLWGDTVNTAQRVESHGVPGAVTLSAEAWRRVEPCCHGEPLGAVAVKGKGELEMVKFAGFREAAGG
jgi:class 3 adenylate cyclase